MRVTAASLLFVCTCLAEQEQKPQKNKNPPPDSLNVEQVAVIVSGLLKPGSDPGDWCKTPAIGLILAQESAAAPKPLSARKAEPLPRRN